MTSDRDPVRSIVPYLIAVLCATALLLIVLILGGSDINETSAKAIATAGVFAAFSLTGVAGLNLAGRRPKLALFGYLTTIISIGTFVLVTAAIWGDEPSRDWHLLGDALVLTFASAHGSLLLGSRREGEKDAVRLLRTGTLTALGLLALMAVIEISSPHRDEVGVQPLAILSVVYVLGTILMPLVRRLSPPQTHFAGGVPAEPATRPPAGPETTLLSTGPATMGMPRVLRLDHLVIAVSDQDRSTAFYRDVLGTEVLTLPNGRVAYRIGGQQLNVHGPGATPSPLAAEPVRPGNSDLCFVWGGPLPTAIEHLQRQRIEIIEGPVGRIGAQGPGQSVYFRDPDGSVIELISYS